MPGTQGAGSNPLSLRSLEREVPSARVPCPGRSHGQEESGGIQSLLTLPWLLWGLVSGVLLDMKSITGKGRK